MQGVLLLLISFSLMSLAYAQPTQIRVETDPDDPTSRLELRNITLPDGSESEIYVVQGSPVRVTIDEDIIIANYIEFDLDNNLLRIVGEGRFISTDESIEGSDFTVDLRDNAFTTRDVVITTSALDLSGLEATRFPGQINIGRGYFSPCSRCGQDRNDYGFRATRLQLYPGDRLIAYNVVVEIRDLPAFFLPLMVIPLGPAERQPRLSLVAATENDRAEVALTWPYVSGANAFGNTTLRYYADVDVTESGNFFENTFLGGRVIESYVGGAVEHTFFGDNGEGTLDLSYTPGFIDRDSSTIDENGNEVFEKEDNEFIYDFHYSTFDFLPIDQVEINVERDDTRRQRISEYDLTVSGQRDWLEGRFVTQGFIDHSPNDDVTDPSYDTRSTARRTLGEFTLTAIDQDVLERGQQSGGQATPANLTLGPFSLTNLQLQLGMYEDDSNPSNRSAAQRAEQTLARVLEQHQLSLNPVDLWTGAVISGTTDFEGKYYSSNERQINWNTTLNLEQSFSIGTLNLTFQRDTNEGETPFRFDIETLRSRTDFTTRLDLTPADWLAINIEQTSVFVDSRNPDNLGAGPINTTVTLFNNLRWLDIRLQNDFDIEENDPGELDVNATLRSTDLDFNALLDVDHTQDLKPTVNERLDPDGEARDTSTTDVRGELGYRGIFALDASTGYVYDPTEPTENLNDDPDDDIPLPFWDPLELGATLGTLEQDDQTPGLRVSYERDLNLGEAVDLGIQATTTLGFLGLSRIELSLEQNFNFERDRLGTSQYSVIWRDAVAFEASGFAIIPPSFFGLTVDEEASETWNFTLRDETQSQALWRLTYRTTKDPTFLNRFDEEGGFRDSEIEAFINAEDALIDDIRFSVDFFGELQLADDRLPRTYLSQVRAEFFSDFYSRVGFQGDVTYNARYNIADDEITRAALTLDDVGITVRATDELYISTIFNDVWDFAVIDGEGSVDESPFNFQPEIRVVWDRCCWALYGSWDTASGEISLAIAAPGGDPNVQQQFDSGLRLPGRETGAEDSTP
ncbi:MAG: hypothetical protein AAF267_19445 [Deinococcota bacterium]